MKDSGFVRRAQLAHVVKQYKLKNIETSINAYRQQDTTFINDWYLKNGNLLDKNKLINVLLNENLTIDLKAQ